eukprot:CAMPEP_0204878438 /NCGR_PEP_ID=MMETSP1348-20121228/48751_1 /ASSEMBLY_ACC=CAM_ASM_000700 /TAXON_ID=215587 /ORGANISM="Aplanochytrium stocchinoi, Strain GSBS06" /LENGTH=516 /DNA_ID=CAMNT_0052035425 /DNA_START=275 /DNA_END=1825 /DNA_ORIENTATION=-
MATDEEIELFETLTLVASSIGFVMSLFLTLTWGIFPEKSKQKMTFWLSFASFMMTVSIFIPALVKKGRVKEVWCKNEAEGFQQEDKLSFCVIQGLFIVFWGLAYCGWWFCSCIDIFSKLYLRKRHIEHYLRYYHYWSWGTATSSAGLLLVLGHFGFEQPRVWCFLDDEVDEYIEYLFFYIPIGIQWLIGTTLMVMVIWRVVRRTTKNSDGRFAGFFAKLKLYQTPIAFILVFNLIWFIFISFRLLTLIGEDGYIESAQSWVECLLGNLQFAGELDPAVNNVLNLPLIGKTEPGLTGCGFVQPGRIEPRLFGLTVFVLSGNGIMLFLIFGFNRENFILWRRFFDRKCPCGAEYGIDRTAALEDMPSSQASSGMAKIRNLVDGGVSTFTELRRGLVWLFYRAYIFICCKTTTGFSGPAMHPVVRFEGTSAPTWNHRGNDQNNRRGPHPLHAQKQRKKDHKEFVGDHTTRPRYFFNSEIASEDVGDLAPGDNKRNNKKRQASIYGSDFSDTYVDPLWGI